MVPISEGIKLDKLTRQAIWLHGHSCLAHMHMFLNVVVHTVIVVIVLAYL